MLRIFSVVLSLQLIMMPLSGIANTTTQTNENQTPPEAQASKEVSEVGTNADYDARSQKEGGYGRFAKQILGASTAIIGANIISQCSFGGKVPSILAFMGGSIAYLVSELAGGKKQNEEHKQRLEKIEQIKKMVAENKGGGDVQRELIEQRLEEEKKILEFVKQRSMWGSAIMAIYLVAAALAIKEEMGGKAAGKGAGVSTCAGLAAQYASPCSGPKYPGCYKKHYSACTKVAPAGEMAAKAAFMSPTSVATGQAACGAAAIYAPACQADLTAYLAIAYANCQPLGMGNISVAGFSTNLFSAAYGMGFSMASTDKMQTYLQLAVSLTGLFTKTITTKITALYSYPIPRAATFAAHAGLMGAIIMGLKQVQGQTEKNIEELTKVVNNFRNETDDDKGMPQGSGLADGQTPGGQNSGGQTSGGLAGTPGNGTLPSNSLKPLPSGVNPSDVSGKFCLSTQSGMEISSSACKAPLKVNPIKVSFNEKDRNLDTSVTLINDLNRAVEEGNLDAAKTTAGKLGSMAVGLGKNLDDLKTAYNKDRKADGESEYDFAKEEKLRMEELEAGKQDLYNDFEKNTGIKIASLAPGDSSISKSDVGKANPLEVTSVSGGDAVGVNTGIDLSKVEDGLHNQSGSLTEEDSSLLYGGETNTNNPDGLNDEAYRAALANGYLLNNGKKNPYVGDGVSDSGANIFKNISKRYFLSYPRFFKKKEIKMTDVK